jgi:hypothetical protein
VISIFVSEGIEISSNAAKRKLTQLSVKSSNPFSSDEKIRIENWFKARLKDDAVLVAFETTRLPPKITKTETSIQRTRRK